MKTYNIAQETKLTIGEAEQLQVNVSQHIKQLSSKVIVINDLTHGKHQAIKQGNKNQPTHIKTESGFHYTLSIQKEDTLDNDFDLIAKKVENDLEVILINGNSVVFDNYFKLCSTELSCVVSLPGKNGLYHITDSLFFALDEGSIIVYFYGKESTLKTIANSQSPLFSSSFSTDFIAMNESDGSFSILNMLSVVGIGTGIAIGSVGDGGGSPLTVIINGFISLGPVIKDNGLYVQAYKLDGVTKISNEVKVASDGSFTLNLGSYTNIVIFKTIDKSAGMDYYDEATKTATDLAGSLSAIVNIKAGNQHVNINVLTELAFRKTSATSDAAAVNKANTDTGKAFNLDDIISNTPNLVIDNNGGDIYDTSDDYGKVLAALSGIDKIKGDSEQAINYLENQFTTSGDQLTDEAKDMLNDGAAHVNLAGDNAITVITNRLAINFEDTGQSSTDSIVIETNLDNNTKGILINVTNQDSLWVFSINGGTTWAIGTGDNFKLPTGTGTYNQSDIMVRNGTNITTGTTNASLLANTGILQIQTETSVPIFYSGDETTTVAGSSISKVVYDAQVANAGKAADLDITYSLKSVGNADLFRIDPNTGEVTYRVTQNNTITHNIVIIASNGTNTIEKAVKINVISASQSPTVVIINNTEESTTNNNVVFTFIFSENVIGFDATDIIVTGGNKGEFTGLGQVYTLVVTPNAGTTGTISINVSQGAAKSANNGLDNLASNTLTQDYNTKTLNQPNAKLNNDTGSNTDNITSDATINAPTNTGVNILEYRISSKGLSSDWVTNYDAIKPTKDSDYTLEIRHSDVAGNSAIQTISFTLDASAPIFISAASASIVKGSLASIVVYDAQASDQGISPEMIDNGITYSIENTGNGNLFTIDADSGVVKYINVQNVATNHSLSIIATDIAGNSAKQTVLVNITDVSVLTLTISDDISADKAIKGETITFTFAFSAGVESFDANDITLTGSATSKGAFKQIAAELYTLAVMPTNDIADGVVGVSLAKDRVTSLFDSTVKNSLTSYTQAIDTLNPGIIAGAKLANDSGARIGQDSDNTTKDGAISAPTSGVEAGATVQYKITYNGAEGEWQDSYTAPAIDGSADGSYLVAVRQQDSAGNIGAQQQIPINFILDTSINPPIVKLTTDSAINGVNTDHITNNGALSITDIETGAVVEYSVQKDSNTASPFSETYTPPAIDGSADGNYIVLVRQTDKAGNVSTETRFSYALDTSISTPNASLTSDTGQNDDKITSNSMINESVNADNDITQYRISSEGLSSDWVTNYDAIKPTKDSDYTLEIRHSDVAGNSAIQTIVFTLDASAPIFISAASASIVKGSLASIVVYDSQASDQGISPEMIDNGITYSIENTGNGNLFTIDADSGVVKYINVQNVATNHSLSIIATDIAGNSAKQTVLVNITDVSVLTLTISDDISADKAIKGETITFTFAFSAGVESFDASDITLTGSATSKGAFKQIAAELYTLAVMPTNDIADGVVGVSLAKDRVTSLFDSTVKNSLTSYTQAIDTLNPGIIAGAKLANDSGARTGQDSDNTTKDGSISAPTSGVEAGATVQYKITYNGAEGEWQDSYTAPAIDGSVDGSYLVAVRQQDSAGNIGAQQQTPINFILDTSINPPIVKLTTDSAINGVNTDHITNNGALSITDIETGAVVEYSVQKDSNTASPFSETYTPPAIDGSADGNYIVLVRQTDKAGNVSTETSFSYRLDTRISTPNASLTSDTGQNDDNITSNSMINESVNTDNDITQYRISSEGLSSDWVTNYDAIKPTKDSDYTLEIRHSDVAGNSAIQTISFTLDASAPIFISAASASIVKGSLASIVVYDAQASDQGISPEMIDNGITYSIENTGNGNLFTIDADSGVVKYINVQNVATNHSLSIIATDIAGNSAKQTVLVNITDVSVLTLTISDDISADKAIKGETITFTFAFSAGVESFDANDITLTGSATSKGAFKQIAAELYTLAVMPTNDIADGVVGVSLAKDRVTSLFDSTVKNSLTSYTQAIDTLNPGIIAGAKLANDSGARIGQDSDNTTKDGAISAPTSGVEAGATVQYKITYNGAEGEWQDSYTAPAIDGSADGSYLVAVRQQDSAGNIGAQQQIPINFILDTSINPPIVKLTTDSAINGVNTDHITNNGALSITDIETGAVVEYSVQKDSNTASPFSETYTPPAIDGSADGNYIVLVRQTDKAGNVSTETRFSYALDTSISTPNASLTSDTGQNDDKITSNSMINESVNADNDITQYRISSEGLSSDWVTNYDAIKPTKDSDYTLEIRHSDVAGNSAIQTIVFTLDASAPIFISAASASIVKGSLASIVVYDSQASDQGISPEMIDNGITYSIENTGNGNLFTIDADSGVVKYINVQNVATNHSLSIIATDIAGNSAKQTVLVNITDVSVLTLTISDDISADKAIKGETITFTFAFSAGVESFDANDITLTGSATSKGAFKQIAAELYTLAVMPTNDIADGVVGVSLAKDRVTSLFDSTVKNSLTSYTQAIDTLNPGIIAGAKLANDSGARIGQDSDNTTKDGAISAPTSGVEAGATVQYKITYNGAEGEWQDSYTAPAIDGSADGSYLVAVRQQDSAGNIGAQQQIPINFILDTSINPPIVKLTTDSAINGVNTDHITNNGALSITDIETGAVVEYSVQKDSNTASPFSETYTPPAIDGSADGNYIVLVRQTDKAGNVSTETRFSYALDTSISTPNASLTSDTGQNDDKITSNSMINESVNADNDITQYRISSEGLSSDWVTNYDAIKPTKDSDYTLEIRHSDVAGNSAIQTIVFTLDASAPIFISAASASIVKGSLASIVVYDSQASDQGISPEMIDNGITYSIENTGNGNLFTIDADSGVVKYINVQNVATNHSLSIIATDIAGNSAKQTVLVNITDVSVLTLTISDDISADKAIKGETITFTFAFSAGVESFDASDITLTGSATSKGAFKQIAAELYTLAVMPTNDIADGVVGVSLAKDRVTSLFDSTVKNSLTSYTQAIDTLNPGIIAGAKLANDSGARTGQDSDNTTKDGSISAPTSGVEAGATVQYKITYNGAEGEWQDSYTAPAIDGSVDGSYLVAVRQQDSAGNIGAQQQTPINFILDTSINPPIVKLTTDSAINGVNTDHITNNGALSITDIETGAVVEYSVQKDSNTASPFSETYTPPAIDGSADGNYIVLVRQTDKAGNVSTETSFSYRLDTRISTPNASLTSDTGQNDDNITSNSMINESVNTDNDITQYRISSEGLSSDWVTNYDAIKPTKDSDYTLEIRHSDVAGNSAIQTISFTLDASAPIFISAASASIVKGSLASIVVYDAQASDQGISPEMIDNGITYSIENTGNGNLFTIDADSGVVKYINVQNVATNHSLSIIATDIAGNSAKQTVLVNITDVSVLTLTISDDISADKAIKGETITFTFAFSAGVESFDASDITLTGSATSKGAFKQIAAELYTLAVMPTNDIADGVVGVSLAKDRVTSLFDSTVKNSLTSYTQAIDTLNPGIIAGAKLANDSGARTGQDSDNTTKDGSISAPTSGVEAGATVQYKITYNGAEGEWQDSYTAPAIDGSVDGSYLVAVRQQDSAGNIGAQQQTPINFILDTSINPPIVKLTTDSAINGVNTDHITNNGALSITDIETGAVVEYSVQKDSNAASSFSETYTPPAIDGSADGNYIVLVRQTDKAGNVSTETSFSYRLDTSISTPNASLTSDTGQNDDNITSNSMINESVNADNDITQYRISSEGLSSDWVTNYDAIKPTKDSDYTLEIRHSDVAGNSAIQTISFTLDASAPIFISAASASIVKGSLASIVVYDSQASDQGISPEMIDNGITYSIENTGNGNLFTIDADSGVVKYINVQNVATNHSLSIIATDIAGNSAKQTVLVNITDVSVLTLTISDDISADKAIKGETITFTFAFSAGVESFDASDITLTGSATSKGAFKQIAAELYTLAVMPTNDIADGVVGVSLAKDRVTSLFDSTVKNSLTSYTQAIDTLNPGIIAGAKLANDSGARTGQDSDNTTKDGSISAPTSGVEAGATVQYKITYNGAEGEWQDSYTAPAIDGSVDGSYLVAVRQQDSAGNIGAQQQTPINFILDTSINPPIVKLTTDSAINGVNTDHITNNGALSITDIETGAVVEYSVQKDSNTASPFSETYTPPAIDGSADGNYIVLVRQTDKAGNVSTETSFSYRLDTRISTPNASLTSDTGQNDDNITSNSMINESVNTDNDITQYRISSEGLSSDWVTNYDAIKPTKDSDYTLEIRHSDVAGNSAIQTISFTLDASAPIFISAASASIVKGSLASIVVYDAQASDQGISPEMIDNGITYSIENTGNGNLFTIDADSGVVKYINVQNVATNHSLSIIATDIAGNSAKQTVLVNITDVSVLTLTISDDISADKAIKGETITFTFAFSAGVESFDASDITLTGSATSKGAFKQIAAELYTLAVMPTNDIADGVVGVSLAKDRVTSLFDSTVKNSLTSYTQAIDTLNPGIIAGAKLANDSGARTGQDSDNTTKDGSISAPTSGVEAGATVQYKITYNGAEGEWQDSYTAPAIDGSADGSYLVAVRQQDLAGNIGAQQQIPINFILDTSINPPIVKLTTDSAINGVNTDHITNNGALSITDIETGAVVEYSVQKDSNTASPFSETYTPPAIDGSADGNYIVLVRQTDKAGNVSTETSFSYRLDTRISTPNASLTNDSGNNTDRITNNASIIAPTNIEYDNIVKYKLTKGELSTNWTTTYTAPTESGNYTLEIKQIDVAGNEAIQTLTFTFDDTAPIINSIATDNKINSTEKSETITGTTEANGEIILTIGANNRNITADANGNWSYTLVAADFKKTIEDVTDFSFKLTGLASTDNAVYTANLGTGLTNGKKLWITATQDSNIIALQVEITQVGDKLAFSVLQVKTEIESVYNAIVDVTPSYFDANGTAATLANTATDAGFTLADITINGIVTAGIAGTTAVVINSSADLGLSQGSQTIVASDIAGNQTSRIITVNTIKLIKPNAVMTDTGISITDGITNDATLAEPTNSGTDTVEYRITNKDGIVSVWSNTYIKPTINGAYTLEVRHKDTSGNVSVIQSIVFTLDTDAPVINTVAIDDKINVDESAVTTITGMANDNEVLSLAIGGNTRSVNVNNNGIWSYTLRAVDFSKNLTNIGGFKFKFSGADITDNSEKTYTLSTTVATGDKIWLVITEGVTVKAVQIELTQTNGALHFKALAAKSTTTTDYTDAGVNPSYFDDNGTDTTLATTATGAGYAISDVVINSVTNDDIITTGIISDTNIDTGNGLKQGNNTITVTDVAGNTGNKVVAVDTIAPPEPDFTFVKNKVVFTTATAEIAAATITGTTVQGTGANSTWGTSGVYSTNGFTGNGLVTFTAVDVDKGSMVGLSVDNPDANYNTIDYAIYLDADGTLDIYENTTRKVNNFIGGYKAGDIFKIERIGTEIKYYKGTKLIYTSIIASAVTDELHFDAAFLEKDAEISNVAIESSFTNGDIIAVTDIFDFNLPTNTGANETYEYRIKSGNNLFSEWLPTYVKPIDGGEYTVEFRHKDDGGNYSSVQQVTFTLLESQVPTLTISNNISDRIVNSANSDGSIIFTFNFNKSVKNFTKEDIVIIQSLANFTFGYTFLSNGVVKTTQDVTTASDFSSGDMMWVVAYSATEAYARAVQLQITQIGTALNFKMITGKYVTTSTYETDSGASDPNYFDTHGTNNPIESNPATTGYAVKDITINGNTTTGVLSTSDTEIIDYALTLGDFTKINANQYTLVVTPVGGTEGKFIIDIDEGAAINALTGEGSESATREQQYDFKAPILAVIEPWKVSNLPGGQEYFIKDDVISITMTLDEELKFGNTATNSKITIAGKSFDIDVGSSNASAGELIFNYTVALNDFISAADFDVEKAEISLTGITDLAGNTPDLDSITEPVEFKNVVFKSVAHTTFEAANGSVTNGVYTKNTSDGSWNGGFWSDASFLGDGYATHTLVATPSNKQYMFGLSTVNEDDGWRTLDYALFMFNGTLNDIRVQGSVITLDALSGSTYEVGATIKLERIGTELKFYYITIAEFAANEKGTLIKTLTTGVSEKELHIDSSVLQTGISISGELFQADPPAVDARPPLTVAITDSFNPTSPTPDTLLAGDDVTFTFTFSDAVENFNKKDIIITNEDFVLPSLANFTFGYTFLSNGVVKTTQDVTTASDFSSGDIMWVVAYSATEAYARAVQLQITQIGTALNFKMITGKYVTTSTYETDSGASDPNYFDTHGTNNPIESNPATTGYAVKDITINGNTTTTGVLAIGDTEIIDYAPTLGALVAVSASEYTLAVTPVANFEGTIKVDVAANTASSIATDKGNSAATTHEQQYDFKAPILAVIEPWKVSNLPDGQEYFIKDDVISITMTLDEELKFGNTATNSKITIAGKSFDIDVGSSNASAGELIFNYTVALNDFISAADFDVEKAEISLIGITDLVGNIPNFDSMTQVAELGHISTVISNIGLQSAGLVNVSSNVTDWNAGTGLSDVNDGDFVSDYDAHPSNANNKYILFDFKGVYYYNAEFKFYNRPSAPSSSRINSSTVNFYKNNAIVGTTYTFTDAQDDADNIISFKPDANMEFDQVKIIFSGYYQNFKEIEILGSEVLSVDGRELILNITDSFEPSDSVPDILPKDTSLTFTFTFSEDVNDFTKSDIVLTNTAANEHILPLDATGTSDGTTNTLGAVVTGNSIKANTGISWSTSGVYFKDGFTGNGSMSFTAATTEKGLIAGLSTSNNKYNALDYAIYLLAYHKQATVLESGGYKGGYFFYDIGDIFTIKRIGTVITYYKNGGLIYTSNVASSATDELHFDSAFNSDNGEIKDIVIKNDDTVGDLTQVSAREYTLAVTPVANFEGTIKVDVAANTALSIAIDKGNAVAVTHEQQYDFKSPTVGNIDIKGTEGDGTTEKSATLVAGDKIIVTLDMSEAVVLTEATEGNTTYAIKIDGVEVLTKYDSSLSSARKMVFAYTVTNGAHFEKGRINSNIDALTLIGTDTLKDLAGNTVNINTPALYGRSRYVLIKQDGNNQSIYLGEVEVMVDGVNVALNKSVSADSSLTHHTGWSIDKIVDGKNNSTEGMATTSAQTDGWVQIDLGQEYEIDSITLKAISNGTNGPDNTNHLTVFTSATDNMKNSTLTEIKSNGNVTEMGTTSGITSSNFTNSFYSSSHYVISRYVLIKQDGNNRKIYLGEVEVMVDGVNVALNKSVSADASLIHYNGWTINEIVDGNNGSEQGMATSSSQTDGWVQIDLGQEYEIDSITLKAISNGTNGPDNTNHLTVFTSATDNMKNSTLTEIKSNGNVTEMGTTSGITSSNFTNSFTAPTLPPFTAIKIDATPLTIDLNDDGKIDYLSLANSTAFYDMDDDGEREHSAWVAPQDGLIGYDANNDGKISGRMELVLSDYVKGAKTDLEGMAYFDTNKDGFFTQNDEHWNNFKIWQDKNSDGISNEAELFGLDQIRINKIELTSNSNKKILADGDITEYGQFKIYYADSAQGVGGDSSFAYQNSVINTNKLVNNPVIQPSATTSDDVITGTNNNDTLNALAGNDSIYASSGNDVLTGGTGNNAFIYGVATGMGFGSDTITDWTSGDSLNLSDLITNNTKTASELITDGVIVITGTQGNIDTTITIAHTQTTGSADTIITLTGVAFTDQDATIFALGDALILV